MKPKSNLTSRFLAYRKAARNVSALGALAVVSLSALRVQQTLEDKDTARRIGQFVRDRHPDDEAMPSPLATQSETLPTGYGLTSYMLTPNERALIPNYRPFVTKPTKSNPVNDEPLPPDFVAPAVEEYHPLIDPALNREVSMMIAFELAFERDAAKLATLTLTA